MNWLPIALITPITHAIANHIDKYVLSRYLKDDGIGFLVIFSCLFSLLGLPIITFLNPAVFLVPWVDALVLAGNGALIIFAYILYFHALDEDEASIVTPLFQFIPVFGFILGYTILGETLTRHQIGGSIVILCGAFLLSLAMDQSEVKIKKKVLLFMLGSSLLYAINGVVFKLITVSTHEFLPSLFWDFVGKSIIGIIIFIFVKYYRYQFMNAIRQSGARVLALNFFNGSLALAGEIAVIFAVLLAPVALVQVVSGLQPLFVLIFGILLTLFFPAISEESLTKKDLSQKIFGILAIVFGTILTNI